MLKLTGLSKQYGPKTVVNNINLQIEPGEIYGFLGPNGAGKTTTLMMILGIIQPTTGQVEIFNQPVGSGSWLLRQKIGVMEEVQHLYEEMSAWEYLKFFAGLYRVERPVLRIETVLNMVKLWEVRHQRLREYSKGMQQKMGLARALLPDPPLLILDEPVSSLDPYGIRDVREIIREENWRGKTILVSSHVLSEVEKTCSRIGIMNQGQLVADASIDVVKRMVRREQRIKLELDQVTPELLECLRQLPFVKSVNQQERSLMIRVEGHEDYRRMIARTVTEQGGLIIGFEELESSLEDAFVTLTDQSLSELLKEAT